MQIVSFVFALAVGEPAPDCAGSLDRAEVVRCARLANPRHAADLARVDVARADRTRARVLLPTNPDVGVTVARRSNVFGARALNVAGTIGQELEIGGQRRKRIETARASERAAEQHAASTEREVVAEALVAYYDALASASELELMVAASRTADRLDGLAQARASAGLATFVEAELAAAESARVRAQTALARGRLETARARLAVAIGADPARQAPRVEGGLDPLPVPPGALEQLGEQAGTARPELAEADAVVDAEIANLSLLRRSRAPNPRLSFFVQRDGFGEDVIGGGLGFPLPLPAPLGRTNKGEIEASRARIREADARRLDASRRVELEVAVAFHELAAHRDAADAYSGEADARARQSLAELAAEIEGGRLPIGDALRVQALLQERLRLGIEARHRLCVATVALVLAAGLPFEEVAP